MALIQWNEATNMSKELRKFEPSATMGTPEDPRRGPYRHQEFPKMVYKAQMRKDGKVDVVDPRDENFAQQCTMIVGKGEERSKEDPLKVVRSAQDNYSQDMERLQQVLKDGWSEDPEEAIAKRIKQEDDLAREAAMRAYDDRNMSTKARAEVEVAEAAHDGFMAEKPEAPRVRKPRSDKGQKRGKRGQESSAA